MELKIKVVIEKIFEEERYGTLKEIEALGDLGLLELIKNDFLDFLDGAIFKTERIWDL